MKKDWEFPKVKIKGHVCSGCIEIFPAKELTLVSMPAGYSTIFCTPCIEKDGITKERIGENYHEHQKAEHERTNPWRKQKTQDTNSNPETP